MNNDALFSVVIPAYNRERTIERSIKSILDQSYKNWELIIIDDGSKDKTKEVVKPFLNNRIFYFYQENSGAQVARNNGLEHARGEYIIFLDSDDELLPTCLEKMAKCYIDDPEIGAVYCQTGLKNNDGTLRYARNDFLSGNVYKEVLEQGYLTSSSFISMRTLIFEEIGKWDEQFPASQDDDICFRITREYKVKLLNEILGIYYYEEGKNRIGGVPKRVALGWWLLWSKYENDVLFYCGKKVLIKHLEECLERFTEAKDQEHCEETLKKLQHYISRNEMNKLKLKMFYWNLKLSAVKMLKV